VRGPWGIARWHGRGRERQNGDLLVAAWDASRRYIGDGEREHIIQSVGGSVVAVILLSPASPLHPALPSGRVTGGLIDGAEGSGPSSKPDCTAPMHSVSTYEVPRDKRQRPETPVQPISSVLSAQPDAMAIGPVGVIGCRRPLTSRAKGDFRQVDRSPAPGRGTHFSPPSALSLSLCPALPPQLHDLFSLPARSRPLAISLCANPSSLSSLSPL
jgi:hypothetical protein